MKRIGIIYHPKRVEAVKYSRQLDKLLKKAGVQTWLGSAWEPHELNTQAPGSDLVISIGGDGTILRAAKAIIPQSIPILGINLGNLGFMSELTLKEAETKLSYVLSGKGWVEERALIEISYNKKTFYALNDVFIGRRSLSRLVTIHCKIDGEPLATFRVDGIIIATASGSTAYSLAAGGPILHPQSKEIILQPVSPHFSFDKSLVLPLGTLIDLTVSTTHEAMISMDGQAEEELKSGDRIRVKLSKYTARFLRLQSKKYFYKTLDSKLQRKI